MAAVVVAEDHRFLLHKGIDHVAIIRATVRFMKGRWEGGSTIEQQVVRVLTGDYRKILCRKLKELVLASCIGEALSKEQLLCLYLEIAYFGKDAEGIHALTNKLGLQVSEITFEQAAKVAACLKYPLTSQESSCVADKRTRRADHILMRMKVLSTKDNNASTCK